jgi:hypothetical protein
MARSRSDPFRLPAVSYDYEPLIGALAECRAEVERLVRECGNRTPLSREAQAVIADIDGLAKLLPEGAASRVSPPRALHSTRTAGGR